MFQMGQLDAKGKSHLVTKKVSCSPHRFHPMIIGTILVVFLLAVSAFISYMETITYFDAFYACFITYSTIGFGDIDIYVRNIIELDSHLEALPWFHKSRNASSKSTSTLSPNNFLWE